MESRGLESRAMSDDEPVIDLLDQRGRLTRFFIAAAAAIATVVVVGPALYAWVDPEHQASYGGWKFVFKQCIPRWNVAIQVDDEAPEHRRTF